MFAIYKRELRSYFTSMVGYVFIAAVLFFAAVYFMVYCLNYGYSKFGYVLQSATLIFMVAIPILTMRSMAEERRSRTDQLLLTAPVSTTAIVLGKYFAMVTVLAIPMLVLCTCPLVILTAGSTNLAADYASILAFFLMGCVFIAVGMLVSSLTESQIIAAVGTFAILLILYLWDGLAGFLPGTLGDVLGQFNFRGVLSNFAEYSVFDLGGVILYLSIAALLVFAAVQAVSRRRGVRVAPLLVVTVAVCVVVNLAVGQLPANLLETDLTDNSLYSVSDTSQEFLDGLEDDVSLVVLADQSSVNDILKKFLANYAAASPHVSVEYIDPVSHPAALTEYDASADQIVVTCAATGRSRAVNLTDILVYDAYYYYYYNELYYTEFDGEGQLASAISYVTQETSAAVYTLTGHGEASLNSVVTDAIGKANLTSGGDVNLLLDGAIPEECGLLVCNAPASDFSAEEVELLSDYLAAGGQFVLLLPLELGDMPNLEGLMEKYGMSILDGYVGDTERYYQALAQYYGYYGVAPVLSASSDVTSSISDGNILLYAPHAIELLELDEDSNVTVTSFLTTGSGGFLSDGGAGSETVPGTYTLGAAATWEVSDDDGGTVTGRFTVFGSESLIDEGFLTYYSSISNLDLFMNAVTVGLGDVTGPAIASKSLTESYNTFTNPALWTALYLGVIPLGTLLFGLVFWLQRRKK